MNGDRGSRVRAVTRRRAGLEMTGSITVSRRFHKPNVDPGSLVVTTTTSQVIYAGPAFIHQLGNGPEVLVGEQGLPTNTTVISIPMSARGPHVDDIVRINSCAEDPSLAGIDLRCVSTSGGGIYSSTRQLVCVFIAYSQRWEPE